MYVKSSLKSSEIPVTLCTSHRNQLHLQRAQLQQALSDVRGGVEFAERLLTCGSNAEILSAKGVTLRRLTSLAESGYDPRLATVSPDDACSICFIPEEQAGEVDGYPVVGVIHSKTLDLNKCTIEGEGEREREVTNRCGTKGFVHRLLLNFHSNFESLCLFCFLKDHSSHILTFLQQS